MSLNERLEQLAFGRALPEMSHCVGLYLNAGLAYLAEARIVDGKPRVEHLVRVPLPAPAAPATRTIGVLNADMLADTGRVAALLKQAMSGAGRWRAEYAVVTLGPSLGLLRYFVMPAIDPKYWKVAVAAEAKKYIPMPFDDLATDYQVEPLPTGADKRARQAALFGVAPTRNLHAIRALVQELGLKIAGVELAPCSVARVWDLVEPSGGAPYAQVHFDQGEAHVVLSERGLPIFVREIVLGPDARVVDRRKLDLPGCVDFAKKQLAAERPGTVRVSGATPELAAWQQGLSEDAGLPVKVQDTPKLLGIKGGEWGGYAAIGAAARHLAPSRLTIDVSASDRIDDVDRRTAQAVIKAAAAVGALFLAIGLFRHGVAQVKAVQLAGLRAKGASLPAFQGRTSAEIEQAVHQMQTRTTQLNAVVGSTLKATQVLQRVAESAPDSVWLNSVNYTHALSAAAAGAGRTLILQGYAASGNEMAEQDLAMQFRESLQKEERFRGAMGACDVAVNAGKDGGSDGNARTSFTMTCQAKR